MQRTALAHKRFVVAAGAVVVSFTLALLLLGIYHRLLNRELRVREAAERSAREAYVREVALRQDEQRFRLFIQAVKITRSSRWTVRGQVSSWK